MATRNFTIDFSTLPAEEIRQLDHVLHRISNDLGCIRKIAGNLVQHGNSSGAELAGIEALCSQAGYLTDGLIRAAGSPGVFGGIEDWMGVRSRNTLK